MADPPLASNNPFRRKSTVPPTASTSTPTSTSTPSSTSFPLFAAAGASASSLDPAPPSYSIAKSSTFPQSPSDAQPYGGDASGASGFGSGDAFREQLRALPKSSEAPPSTTFLKPKPVKKVRVQSPPPSSPSSVDSVDADFEARFPSTVPGASGSPTARAGGRASSFDYAARGGLLDDRPVRNYADYSSESEDSASDDNDNDNDDDGDNARERASGAPLDASPFLSQQPAPFNPFQKTLGDLEAEQTTPEEASEPAAAAQAGGRALDVDAFRRLLLTGQGPSSAAPMPAAPAPRAGGTATDSENMTDASTVSKHSIFDGAHVPQDTPRTSHEISENDDDRSGLIFGAPAAGGPTPRTTLRKKPPPPSSRHGKLIKAQPKDKEAIETKEASPKRKNEGGNDEPLFSTDANKHLPPPLTRRSTDDDDALDSIFGREAAGKLPEAGSLDNGRAPDLRLDVPGASVPPVSSPPATATSHPKKPTPAPPPRRQAHNRSESRSNPHDRPAPYTLFASGEDQNRDKSPLGTPRSSFDSAQSRSRSSSLIKPAVAGTATSTPANVPAPPPPRRANHASRPSTASFPLPSSSAASPSAVTDNDRTVAHATTPLAHLPSGSGSSTPIPGRLGHKPPPPPTRNVSVRHKDRPTALSALDGPNSAGRPSSSAGVDAVSRRIGGSQPPPPPPTRNRGSSRGSIDSPAQLSPPAAGTASFTPRKASSESVQHPSLAAAQEGNEAAKGANRADGVGNDTEMASHILADLDALRREVDALRGQFKAE